MECISNLKEVRRLLAEIFSITVNTAFN